MQHGMTTIQNRNISTTIPIIILFVTTSQNNPPSLPKPPGPRPGEGIAGHVPVQENVMKVKTNKVGTGAVRVTIPQSVRKPLGIQAGDVLEVSRRGNKIIFEKVKP